MTHNPILSIVIATYNDRARLLTTLDSVRQQELPRGWFQLIVSDGGSTDDTKALVREYGDVVDIFSSQGDQGIYDGMNRGASHATGAWLQFLNCGDTWHDSASMRKVASLLQDAPPASQWAVGKAINLSAQHSGIVIPSVPHNWLRHALGLQPHCHQATWVRRTMFEQLGGHDLSKGLVADFDLILRLGILGAPMALEDLVIDYQGDGVSVQRANEIPGLLHAVRVERMNLEGPYRFCDQVLTRCIHLLNSARTTAGRLRRSSARRHEVHG